MEDILKNTFFWILAGLSGIVSLLIGRLYIVHKGMWDSMQKDIKANHQRQIEAETNMKILQTQVHGKNKGIKNELDIRLKQICSEIQSLKKEIEKINK